MVKTSKQKLDKISKLLLILNCTLTFTLILSCLAPYISLQKNWIIAILGLIFPFLFFLNILLSFYWLSHIKRFILISAIGLLAAFRFAEQGVAFHFSPILKKNPSNIRVLTYNIHSFYGVGQKNAKYNQSEILNLIKNENPDIVDLQELKVNFFNSILINKCLKNSVQSSNYYFKHYEESASDSSGIAIFSRYPIINRGFISSFEESTEIQAIFADIKYNNKTLRIYCLHLQSTHFEKQDHQFFENLKGKVNIKSSGLNLILTKLKIAFIKRSSQAILIKEHMDKCPYPFIVTGDFNDTPASFAVNHISERLKNAFVEKGNGFGFTYHGDFPNIQIDYIMASKSFDVINYKIVKQKLSDHYPVVSDLRLDRNNDIK